MGAAATGMHLRSLELHASLVRASRSPREHVQVECRAFEGPDFYYEEAVSRVKIFLSQPTFIDLMFRNSLPALKKIDSPLKDASET